MLRIRGADEDNGEAASDAMEVDGGVTQEAPNPVDELDAEEAEVCCANSHGRPLFFPQIRCFISYVCMSLSLFTPFRE